MQFSLLGSGSKGNATLVRYRQTTLLIDNGFTLKESEKRLLQLQLAASTIDAILVTHEHGDHIKGVGPLARRYQIPVYMTPGSEALQRTGPLPVVHQLNCHRPFSIKDIEIIPFPVPHDAREACQFVFNSGQHRLGILTDCGHITPHMSQLLNAVDGLILECNHDPELLRTGPYPAALKARVGGTLGHLSNQQAAELLQAIDTQRLQHLVAAHLSEQNNTPQHAIAALSAILGYRPEWLTIAEQSHPLAWRSLQSN